MSDSAPSITHESETQRQFIRLKMPCMAEINGQRYSIKDLSSGGIAIRDIEGYKKGDQVALILTLPFEKFSLEVALLAEVQHADKKLKMIGCRFIDMDAAQISILNHIVRAYIAGDVVGGGDILNIVSRNNFVKVRQHPGNEDQGLFGQYKSYGIYAGLGALTILLAIFIINNITDRLFTLDSPYGVIRLEQYDIHAPLSGMYKPAFATEVKSVSQGDVIGYITRPQSGDSITLYSPCDCFITKTNAVPGQYIAEGSPVVTLTPQKAEPVITAMIPARETHKIRIGTQTSMEISGSGENINGTVERITASEKTILDSAATPVTASLIFIKPDSSLSPDLANRPVFVEIKL